MIGSFLDSRTAQGIRCRGDIIRNMIIIRSRVAQIILHLILRRIAFPREYRRIATPRMLQSDGNLRTTRSYIGRINLNTINRPTCISLLRIAITSEAETEIICCVSTCSKRELSLLPPEIGQTPARPFIRHTQCGYRGKHGCA